MCENIIATIDVFPPRQDEEDYLALVAGLLRDGHFLSGVLLYGLARAVLADGGAAIVSPAGQHFAYRIAGLGLPVRVSV